MIVEFRAVLRHRYATCFGSSITSLRHSSARARMWVLGHQGLAWAQWWPVLLTPFLLLAAEEGRNAVVRIRLREAVAYPALRGRSPGPGCSPPSP